MLLLLFLLSSLWNLLFYSFFKCFLKIKFNISNRRLYTFDLELQRLLLLLIAPSTHEQKLQLFIKKYQTLTKRKLKILFFINNLPIIFSRKLILFTIWLFQAIHSIPSTHYKYFFVLRLIYSFPENIFQYHFKHCKYLQRVMFQHNQYSSWF